MTFHDRWCQLVVNSWRCGTAEAGVSLGTFAGQGVEVRCLSPEAGFSAAEERNSATPAELELQRAEKRSIFQALCAKGRWRRS
jgi:hypothetical protein